MLSLITRSDDMYGDFPTLEEIQRDYKELLSVVENVTTLKDALKLHEKEFTTIEINSIPIELFNVGEDVNIDYIRYSYYGCLDYIYCYIKNNVIETVIFDVWCNAYEDTFINDTTIDKVTDEHKEFMKYMKQEGSI